MTRRPGRSAKPTPDCPSGVRSGGTGAAPPGAFGEADAGLPERAALGGDEAAAAREHRGRRAAVGPERPRPGLHAVDVDMAGREARVEARARLDAVLAVEDARHEPSRLAARRQLELDADPGLDGVGAAVDRGQRALEAEPADRRAVGAD